MAVLVPTTEAELLAIVLSPAKAFGAEADAVHLLRKVKAAVIRKFKASRRS